MSVAASLLTHTKRNAPLIALLPMLLIASAAGGDDCFCRLLPLESRLSAITSAVWTDDYSKIILTDPIGERVMVMSLDGRVERDLTFPEDPKPIAGLKVGSDYVQMLHRYDMHWFDDNLQRRGQTAGLRAEGDFAGRPELYQVFVYDWTVAGDVLFMYGAAAEISGDDHMSLATDPVHGFFTLRLAPPNVAKMVPKIKLVLFSGEEDFYILGHPYAAAIDDTVFFLLMEGFPQLRRYKIFSGESPDYLRGFPGEDDALPEFDVGFFRKRFEIYKELESFEMPVGLYSQDGFLFALYRRPSPGREAPVWEFIQMRPPGPRETEVQVLGRVALPVKGQHVTVLPGPRDWIIFEKSSVKNIGRGPHDIEKMWIIPNELMRESRECPSAIVIK